MKRKNKRGISLIVLVITIIVMIILAASIILSINSSGIIQKAKKAREDSDRANILEAANALYSNKVLEKNGETLTTDDLTSIKDDLKEKGFSEVIVDEIQLRDNKLVVPSNAAYQMLKLGCKIGDVVYGYKLDSSKTSYTTDGTENTYSSASGTSVTIEREASVSWKYMGIDENGDALIVADVTSSTPEVTLGGTGGYLQGPSMLNKICSNLYSSNMGTARNIDMDDVIKLLDYNKDTYHYLVKGSYYDRGWSYFETPEPMRVEEIQPADYIVKAAGYQYYIGMVHDYTPDPNINVNDYYSDAYVLKEADMNKSEKKYLVYDFTKGYWINDICNRAYLAMRNEYGKYPCVVDYGVRIAMGNENNENKKVTYATVYDSANTSFEKTYAVRPVVALSSNVSVSYNKNAGVITLSN